MSRFAIRCQTIEYASAELMCPAAERLYALWRETCAGRCAPDQRDFSIERLRGFLSDVAVVALAPRAEDARYLFVGPALVRLLGRDPTGQTIAQAYPTPVRADVVQAFDRVRLSGLPLFQKREWDLLLRKFGYFRILLPLDQQRGAPTKVLLGIFAADAGFTRASQWRSTVAAYAKRAAALSEAERRWRGLLPPSEHVSIHAPAPASREEDVWYV